MSKAEAKRSGTAHRMMMICLSPATAPAPRATLSNLIAHCLHVSDIMAPQVSGANSLSQLSWTKNTGQLSAEWSTNQVRAAALTVIPLQESAGTEAAASPKKRKVGGGGILPVPAMDLIPNMSDAIESTARRKRARADQGLVILVDILNPNEDESVRVRTAGVEAKVGAEAKVDRSKSSHKKLVGRGPKKSIKPR